MKSPMRRAIFISLCLHLIALIVTFYIVVDELAEDSIDPVFVDVFDLPKTRVSMPRIKVEPIKAAPRYANKSARIIPARTDPSQPTLLRFHHTGTITPNRPQHQLRTAHTIPPVQTEISTAVRKLQANRNTLPQTATAVPSGMGSQGLKGVEAPELQQAHNNSLHQLHELEVDGDAVVSKLNLPGARNPALPKISLGTVMKSLAKKIVKSSGGGPIDVVFVIDASGSMGDNIRGVGEHLTEMVDVYESSDIDYALGLTEFWAPGSPPRNVIIVHQLTKSMKKYQRAILQMQTRTDENALDAIDQTIREMRFRATSKKHLILVTDEPFTSLKGITLDQAIAMCREFGVHVNVLGLRNNEHQNLAKETDGHWHAIPDNPKRPPRARNVTQSRRRNRRNPRALRNATWSATTQISKVSMEALEGNALDIVLFLDTSLSMAEKLPQFLQQFETMVRDWDNALVDYQIGVVRFRTGRGKFNYVNVFQPPQTLADIHKIANLPCQGSEQLLDAIAEGMRKIRLRETAQLHLILITDEPSTGTHSPQAILQLCRELGAKVSVVGTFDSFQQEVAMKTNGLWVPIPDGKTTNSQTW